MWERFRNSGSCMKCCKPCKKNKVYCDDCMRRLVDQAIKGASIYLSFTEKKESENENGTTLYCEFLKSNLSKVMNVCTSQVNEWCELRSEPNEENMKMLAELSNCWVSYCFEIEKVKNLFRSEL